MTRAESLLVVEKMVLVSKYTEPPLRPLVVTSVWHNQARTITRVQVQGMGDRWLDCEGLEIAPLGKRWNKATEAWEGRRPPKKRNVA